MGYVARLTRRSEDMLDATLRGDVATMAEVIEAAHDQEVPLLRYANEADLAALVNLGYLAARDRYAVRREEPAGKGVADVTFIPRNLAEARWRPFIVELKTGGTAAEAVAQIRKRDYAALFADGLLGKRGSARSLAVGIAWDPKTKTHDCLVEELQVVPLLPGRIVRVFRPYSGQSCKMARKEPRVRRAHGGFEARWLSFPG